MYFACFGEDPSFLGSFSILGHLVFDTVRGQDLTSNYYGLTWGEVGATVRLVVLAIAMSLVIGMAAAFVRFEIRRPGVTWLFEIISVAMESIPEPLHVVIAVVVALYLMVGQGWHNLPLFPEGFPNWSDTWIPAAALALPGAFYVDRILHMELQDEITKPYVTTAFAKGLSRNHVVYKHVFANAGSTVLKQMPVVVSIVVSSALFAEFFMDYQGALYQFTDAIGWNMVTGTYQSFEKPFHLPLYQPGLVFVIGALAVGIWVSLRLFFECIYVIVYGGNR